MFTFDWLSPINLDPELYFYWNQQKTSTNDTLFAPKTSFVSPRVKNREKEREILLFSPVSCCNGNRRQRTIPEGFWRFSQYFGSILSLSGSSVVKDLSHLRGSLLLYLMSGRVSDFLYTQWKYGRSERYRATGEKCRCQKHPKCMIQYEQCETTNWPFQSTMLCWSV